MLNVVIPMAGRGSRFANAGYALPKPLILIHKKSLIQCVTENIRPNSEHRFIYLCLQEHLEQYNLADVLEQFSPGCVVVPVDRVTEGAACTVLLAREYIDSSEPLMIANSDQYVETDINQYLQHMGNADGLIMTMKASYPKWSYLRYNDRGNVTLVREKEVISDEATVGIYNFRQGSSFVRYADRMISKNIRVNGEFYVAPVYNEMIADGKQIAFFNIGTDVQGMYGLGTPEDLERFCELPLSNQF